MRTYSSCPPVLKVKDFLLTPVDGICSFGNCSVADPKRHLDLESGSSAPNEIIQNKVQAFVPWLTAMLVALNIELSK